MEQMQAALLVKIIRYTSSDQNLAVKMPFFQRVLKRMVLMKNTPEQQKCSSY